MEFKTFDLERPGSEQELESGSFDIILGTNVVHAVSDVRAALRNIHDLLAPGGSFLPGANLISMSEISLRPDPTCRRG